MFRSFAVAVALLFILLATAGVTLTHSSTLPADAAGLHRPMTAGITEFPLPSSNDDPGEIIVGPDGNLWFGEYNTTKIGRITPAGVATLFDTAPLIGQPIHLTSGPDGAIWFIEDGLESVVGRMTITGTMTTVALPNGWAALRDITTGPDGNLWLTDYGNNRIGRLTPQGVLTPFTLPAGASYPGGITAGPDGALWFSLTNSQLGRITTAGAMTVFTLPSGSIPADTEIITGPDGNLWLSGQTGLVRVTPAGVVTRFPYAVPALPPRQLTVGPDGNLWFGQYDLYNTIRLITRMAPAGDQFSYAGLAGNPWGIATGPDGAIWFTEPGAAKIGRLDPGAVTPQPTPTATGTATATATGTATPTATAAPPACLPAWRDVYSPNVGPLRWMVAINPIDAWASSTQTPLHWDGRSWAAVPISPSVTINAFAARAYNDAWAVSASTDVYHWAGSTWTAMPLPTLPPLYDFRYLADIATYSSTDAWLVGQLSSRSSDQVVPVLYHWDGTVWALSATAAKVAKAPSGGGPFGTSFSKVRALGPHESWVLAIDVGSQGRQWVEHCTGTGCAPVPGTPYDVIAMGGTSPNDGWISSLTSGGATLLQHWDGTTLTPVASPNIGAVRVFYPITPGDVWARGGADYNTWLHWDGTAWTATAPIEGNALDGTAADDMWSVGQGTGGVSRIWHNGLPLTFTDVAPASTFLAPIDALACRGIISGYNCGGPGEPCDGDNRPYFRPGNPVSRGQAAKLVAGAAAVTATPTGQTFADVPPTSTFYAWVEPLAAAGVISGYACGTRAGEPCDDAQRPYYRPSAGVTRGQLSKLVALVAHYSDPPSGQTFEDVPPGSTFYTWVQQVSSRGIIGGYACGGNGEPCVSPDNRPYFRPANGASRGQTAKIVQGVFVPAVR